MKIVNKGLIIYWSMVIIMLLLTIQFNFNLIGFNYKYDEGTKILTIEEGYFKKEFNKIQINEDNTVTALKVMLPINEANRIWKANIYILPIFVASLFLFFNKSFRQNTKFLRWCIIIYLVALIIFSIWDFTANLASFQEVIVNINDFKR